MKKRLLSIVLCSVMVMSLFACGEKEPANNEGTTKPGATTASGEPTTEATTTVKPTTTTEEAITKEPIYFEDFNSATPKVTLLYHPNFDENTGKPQTAGTMPTNEAAVAAGKTLQFTTETPDGSQAITFDGTYAAMLDLEFTGDLDSYTLSFWINPARFQMYSTMFCVGKDLLEQEGKCAWLSVTSAGNDWNWGGNAQPVIWSRSLEAGAEAGVDVWPAYGEAYFWADYNLSMTQKEWHHVVITVDGTKDGWDPVVQAAVPGTVQGTTYIDGQLWGTGPVAKYCVDETSSVYLGINPWDLVQKGSYDNVGIYDYALTAEQVFGLYNAQDGK